MGSSTLRCDTGWTVDTSPLVSVFVVRSTHAKPRAGTTHAELEVAHASRLAAVVRWRRRRNLYTIEDQGARHLTARVQFYTKGTLACRADRAAWHAHRPRPWCSTTPGSRGSGCPGGCPGRRRLRLRARPPRVRGRECVTHVCAAPAAPLRTRATDMPPQPRRVVHSVTVPAHARVVHVCASTSRVQRRVVCTCAIGIRIWPAGGSSDEPCPWFGRARHARGSRRGGGG